MKLICRLYYGNFVTFDMIDGIDIKLTTAITKWYIVRYFIKIQRKHTHMPTSTEKGFSISKWESKYLKCRYRAHRNKVAAAQPAIDCTAPAERPHVRFKKKKALSEDRRQIRIIRENLRVLNTTAEIMNNDVLPKQSSSKVGDIESRPITATLKRNTHILLQWFLHKFGNYIPWWAEISY
ncbi:unnamed protein product [Allacma fusca]|uniref:Uncharacterized protein n=1 Tax=Allacma fusca TaxID=39272 RepID=A0A8J2JAU7_9HEXA|nr:unnamed protein product [Allacma fusca]